MKKYLLITLLVFISVTVFAQNNYQDVVFLKNGSIIRGLIIEQVPNKSIKIETQDKSVFVYQIDEIEKLTKEEVKRTNANRNNSSYDAKIGYTGGIELGYQIGVGDFGMDRIKLDITNGYQIDPTISVGIGTGLRYYSDAEALLIPLFTYVRATLNSNDVTPYFSLGAGYTFDATDRFSGVGFLLNPSTGVRFLISDKSAVNIGLGYEMQKMKFYYSYYEFSKNSGAISISVGITY